MELRKAETLERAVAWPGVREKEKARKHCSKNICFQVESESALRLYCTVNDSS